MTSKVRASQVTTLCAVTDLLYPGANELEGRAIREIVALAMDAPAAANSGHSGTAMALAPLGVMLYSRLLRHDPTHDRWPDRDRFILSCGHASILQYSLAYTFGYAVDVDDLRAFRQAHSRTPGHPEVGHTPTVEVTTGPLGQGIANGVGMAIAERILRSDFSDELVSHRTWVVAGDGCLEEGISHEAASLAGALGLDRLTVFYDDNHITIDGPTELALGDDAAMRFRAYGWHVIEVGERANDLDVLEAAAREAISETTRPTLIIVRSHIGFPSSEMIDRREAHGTPFSASAISATKAVLGVPDEPFFVDPDLPASLVESLRGVRDERASWEARVIASGERGDSLLRQLATHGAANALPDPQLFEAGSSVATRKALQRAMDTFAPLTPGLTAGSADLTDNTGVVLKGALANAALSPGGRQIYFGIREFAMSAILVGQALHGGIRPAGSTFFVFSDYAKPALRLAALSNAPALFVYTHDSVGVGEDGPTHQPIEQLMALRAVPGLHVVRPSDANETVALVRALLLDADMAPTALVLSRQDIKVFDDNGRRASLAGAPRGGYVLREAPEARLTLVGTGSEVSLCLRASDALAERGVSTRVVAMPCWRCFESQSLEYRRAVLRRDVASLSVEAGATLGWARYTDESIGIDSFGMSAPGSYVFNYFNFTVESVVDYVLERLDD